MSEIWWFGSFEKKVFLSVSYHTRKLTCGVHSIIRPYLVIFRLQGLQDQINDFIN